MNKNSCLKKPAAEIFFFKPSSLWYPIKRTLWAVELPLFIKILGLVYNHWWQKIPNRVATKHHTITKKKKTTKNCTFIHLISKNIKFSQFTCVKWVCYLKFCFEYGISFSNLLIFLNRRRGTNTFRFLDRPPNLSHRNWKYCVMPRLLETFQGFYRIPEMKNKFFLT